MSICYWNDFCPTCFGKGAVDLVGDKVKEMGISKVMVVTEADLIKFNVATKVIDALKKADLEVFVFDKCKADAPSDVCDEGAAFARENKIDGIVAVGGGSSIDTGKAICIILGKGGTTIRDYYTCADAPRAVKLIAVPTTAGTGSENSQYAVIGDSATGVKEVPVYNPDLALVDPVMTYTLPAGQTAATGMDALAHCAEGITSKNYNPYAYAFAAEGIRLVMKWLPIAVKEPDNEEAREKMALAANLGGMTIVYTGCQMGHTWAQCFGGKYHIAHGLGCAWGMPGSMVYAAKHGSFEDSKVVADAMGIEYTDKTTPIELAEMMGNKVIELMREINIPTLKSMGYSLEDCLSIADRFPHDAAFANVPGNAGPAEIEEYIRYTYEAYQ
jgi:1,3-propanediol dehydrogenase